MATAPTFLGIAQDIAELLGTATDAIVELAQGAAREARQHDKQGEPG
jgi:hypothetical protein